MTPAESKRLIVTSISGVAIVAAVGKVHETGEIPSVAIPLGALSAGVMLALLAEVQPDIAGKVAAIALITSIFVYGRPAFDAINTALGPRDAAAARPASTTTTPSTVEV